MTPFSLFRACAGWLYLLLMALAPMALAQKPNVLLVSEHAIPVALTNCVLVQSPEKIIQHATIVFREGVIVAAGKDVAIPKDAIVRDLFGAWVYPGFVDAYSHYGLPNVIKPNISPSAAPQYTSKRTGAYAWNDAINAHYQSNEAFHFMQSNADSLLKLGFTAANVMPNDGIFRGTGCLMLVGESNVARALLRNSTAFGLSFDKGSSSQQYPSSLMGAIALVRQTLLEADWYADAQKAFKKNPNQPKYEQNLSLEAILAAKEQALPFVFETTDYQNTLRANHIGKEFKQPLIFKTRADEYRNIALFANLKAPFILTPDFPKAFDVSNPSDAHEIPLEKMREWEKAPATLKLLSDAKVSFALTATGMKEPQQFFANLRRALEYGSTEAELLAALTTTPATLLSANEYLGKLEAGYMANILIASDNIFSEKAEVYEAYVAGVRKTLVPMPAFDIRGTYLMQQSDRNLLIEIEGTLTKPSAKINKADAEIFQDGVLLSFCYRDVTGNAVRLSTVFHPDKGLYGFGEESDGERFVIEASRQSGFKPSVQPINAEKSAAKVIPAYPIKPYMAAEKLSAKPTLIRNVTIWTNTEQGILTETDVLLEGGKIAKIGKGLSANGAEVIDGTGKHLTAGIIDEHSHIAISDAVNEDTHSVTCEVRIGDVIDADDINIYRQLAGGVTAAQLLHGSANPIGGQSAIVKLRWGETAEGLKFDGENSPKFVKFALGENVKQSNAGDNMTARYPQTRMGVEQSIKEAFRRAKLYRERQETFKSAPRNTIAPKPDLQMEALLEILDNKRFITCHSYVQSELTMLMRLAEQEGFRVNTFTHVLEGFKVAEKIKQHGATASSFSDWWAYKFEVYDVTPFNAAMLHERGINVCINSDDAEMGRRLNQEAAKSVKYGGMSEQDALKLVTLNPAKALHIDHRVGSVATGKDADVVLWSAHPLSVYAHPDYTFIEGKCYYSTTQDAAFRKGIAAERARLIEKMRQYKGAKATAAEAGGRKRFQQCCLTGY